MKKLFTVWLAVLSVATATASVGDTTVISTDTIFNLTSPPKDYTVWTVFPDNVTYQKILMRFVLGCGTPACSGWDYTVNTEIGKKSGTMDSSIVAIDTIAHDTTWTYSEHIDYFETGRLITPYGTYMAANQQGFNNSWTHPYYYDVTDYAKLLKDSVNVKVHYDGWTDAFSARVEFLLIEGQPGREVQEVQQIYHAGYGYGNSADFEAQVSARQFYVNPAVTSAKVVVIMTGHGQQGEFDPHFIHIKVNSAEVYSRLLWKDDCGLNPVYPQGGTWVYNRANWCPGEKVPVFEADISPYITPGQNVSVDLDLDDFVAAQGASYGISAYLVTYNTQHNNDVMLEEIIAPNNDKPYLRHNPISTTPIVQIKNTGKQVLTYAQITYWVKGGTKWYYEWHGNLQPFASQQITLPAFDWNGLDTADRIFYAEAGWPNNVPDEYIYNNRLQAPFNMAPKMDSVFVIYFKSNNSPGEDWYLLTGENGDTIRYKTVFSANTITRDTLHLAPGSYAFDFNDLDTLYWGTGDGLSWWVNLQGNGQPYYENAGQLKLTTLNGGLLKLFNPDFGNNVHYEFTVGYLLGGNPAKPAPVEPEHVVGIAEQAALKGQLLAYPNPAHGQLNVEVNLNKVAGGTVYLADITGKVVREYHLQGSAKHMLTIKTESLQKGMYFLQFLNSETQLTRKIVIE